ncbi:MAG: GNAT family N-acetyltransferase [Candidatus Moranbacteria bacterium]|nr:GNAT family N-acetyltransferase [Candidatus Moranbacteria bacterium]
MKTRKATIKDIDKIICLGSLINEFKVNNKVVNFWPKKVLADCINSKNNPILVVENNKEIIGFIIANYNPSFKKAIIENIFVTPDNRGEGIGKLLLNDLLDLLKKLNCEYICSLVEISNDTAIDFYLKNNFDKGIKCVWLDKIIDSLFEKKK